MLIETKRRPINGEAAVIAQQWAPLVLTTPTPGPSEWLAAGSLKAKLLRLCLPPPGIERARRCVTARRSMPFEGVAAPPGARDRRPGDTLKRNRRAAFFANRSPVLPFTVPVSFELFSASLAHAFYLKTSSAPGRSVKDQMSALKLA